MEEMITLSYKLSQSVLKGYISYKTFEELSDKYDGELSEVESNLIKCKEELSEKLKQVDSLLGRTKCIALLNLMNEKCQPCIVKYLQEDFATTDFAILMFKPDMIPNELLSRSVPLHGLPLAGDILKILEDEMLVDGSILSALIRDSIELKSKSYEEPTSPITEISEDTVFVTNHAYKRYIERFRKGTDGLSQLEVEAEILQLFNEAELVWATDDTKGILEEYSIGESSPLDVIEHWFNSSANVMFVLCNGTIKTMFPMDFGFADNINVEITKMQISELRSVYQVCKSDYQKYSDIFASANKEIKFLESEIARLKSSIKAMESDVALNKAKMSHSSKMRTQLQDNMRKELDKLFKKWRNK